MAGLSPIDPSSARPAPFDGWGREAARWASLLYLRLAGWRMEGDWPDLKRAVILAAPHTSNWDGLNMLAAAGYYRIPLNWMGKASLTRGPFGWLLRRLGCIPVERASPGDLVRTMADAFAARERLILAIAPEGTRARAGAWKSGFYHIAHTADVPIILSVLDYGRRTMSLAAVFRTSGRYEEDLALIRSVYRTAKGLRADRFSMGAD